MGIKESILEWKRSKRERGREVALLPEYDRHYYINSYHDKKQTVKKNIVAMSCDMTMRDSTFARFNEIQFDRMMNARLKSRDADHIPDSEFRRITRNRINMVRIMRFNNGLPLVFGDHTRKFWADPHSRYIPEDHIEAAEAEGIAFHRLGFMMRPGRADWIARDIWAKRGHRGYWAMREAQQSARGTGDIPTLHVFLFESFTDVLEFRFHYEDQYEMVS